MTDALTLLDKEEIGLRLDALDKGVREVTKQFSSIQRSLEMIYEDRDLLTDIATDISKVRGLIVQSDKHNEHLTNEVKTIVEDTALLTKGTVEIKTDEMKQKIERNIASVTKKIVENIVHSFDKKDTKLQKTPWYKSLFFYFIPGTPIPDTV